MKYEIEELDASVIKVKNHIFKKTDIADVIIIQIPEEFVGEADTYLAEVQSAFADKNIILTTDRVKFCHLQLRKK